MQGFRRIIKRDSHDFSTSFPGYVSNFSMIFSLRGILTFIPNVRLAMTFMGYSGAESTTEYSKSVIQESAFWSYPIILQQ